jgi:hypothetical protein
MKKLFIALAVAFMLVAVVIDAEKPSGERQGDSPNTGVFGQCGNDEQCDDGDSATMDICDKSTNPGHCVNEPAEYGTPCDGGIYSPGAGECVDSPPVGGGVGGSQFCLYDKDCNDGNDCTNDQCEYHFPNIWAECQHYDTTAACTDYNPCTIGDMCSSGACVPGQQKGCPVGTSCDPSTGNCV